MNPGVFAPERRALTVGILMAVVSFAVEGMGVVPALPTAVRELKGLPLFGWAFSGFMLAWLVGTIGGGLWADARGPRAPMALGLAAFSGGLLLAGAAHRMVPFLAARALQGAGGGGMLAAAYVAIARGYPDALRARMMALTASAWVLPALGGPALSGAIAASFGWRIVFVGIVPLLGVTAVVVLPSLRAFDVRQPPESLTRLIWAVRVALGSGLLLALPNVLPFGAAAVVGTSVVGAALLLPGLRALLPAGTFWARPGLPAGLLVRGLLAFSYFGTEAFVPLGAGELRASTPTQAGLALSAGALGWVAATWTQERLESNRGAQGRALRARAGFMLLALGIATVAAALLTQVPVLLVPLGWAVAGAGVGFAFSAGGLLCLAQAPRGREGEVSGQLQLAEALCTAAGTGVGGALLAAVARSGRSPRQAHAAIFAVTLTAALLGAVVARRSSETFE